MNETLGKLIPRVEIGKNDENGCTVTHIFYESEECCIYLRDKILYNKEKEIHVNASDEIMGKFGEIQPYIDKLKKLQVTDENDKDIILECEGNAHVSVVMNKSNEAIINLNSTYNELSKKIIDNARFVVIVSCSIITILIILICVALNTYFPTLINTNFTNMFIGAACGAELYTILYKDKIDINFVVGTGKLIIIGILQVFIALISSLIVLSAIQFDLILGILKDTTQPYGFILIGATSGFGQTFLLKVFSILEKQ